jgi:hypothetical protein
MSCWPCLILVLLLFLLLSCCCLAQFTTNGQRYDFVFATKQSTNNCTAEIAPAFGSGTNYTDFLQTGDGDMCYDANVVRQVVVGGCCTLYHSRPKDNEYFARLTACCTVAVVFMRAWHLSMCGKVLARACPLVVFWCCLCQRY